MTRKRNVTVVYDVDGDIREASFQNVPDAKMFCDVLEADGIRFRAWNPDNLIIRQSIGKGA